uniref:Coiled-coil domain 40 molecular ruler complex subunit n=1 Tax=Latimeria chalumnae TaxID=7897 RepID=H3BEH5_LATCH
PLMKRFQTALKNHLDNQLEKVHLDLRELTHLLKKRMTEREDVGVLLYGAQQQLALLQMKLEKLHDHHSQMFGLRRQAEEEMHRVRQLYQKNQQVTCQERKKVSELQTEVENLALRLFYMQNMSQDVHSDIAVMKRVARKTEKDKTQAEDLKKKQDLFVDRLTRRVDQVREQIALYEAQTAAQDTETKAAHAVVAEAEMEMAAIDMEKKQLMLHWSTSLIGMSRRDEAYTAMQEALNHSKQQVLSMDSEIEGYKRTIRKEEERNEMLTVLLNRAQGDANMNKKLISQCLAKEEALKAEYSTYTRTLHETEQALTRAIIERDGRLSELHQALKQVEEAYRSKLELEEQIMEKLQEELTLDKRSKHCRHLAFKLCGRKRELAMQFSKLENEVAQTNLEINHMDFQLGALQNALAELNKVLEQKGEATAHCQNEITKRHHVVERKQNAIDQYNKRIEHIVASLGGEELGPLEIMVKTLTKQIDEQSAEICRLQQFWLRQQNDLVKLTQQRESQNATVKLMHKQFTVLQQRKLRTENEIRQESNEKKDIERHMRNLRNDMVKLNLLLNKNATTKEELEQGNTLMETDFILALKEAERDSIRLQERLDRKQEEKEGLLTNLVEAERQIMLWEKKIQLAKETRTAVDSDVGQGEIRAMRAEIHRMQVRYTQLMKQQEMMIRDMEASVLRRDTIVTRGEAIAKKDKKQLNKSNFHYKLQDLQKKIKEIQKNADDCNGLILELRENQTTLGKTLEEKQQEISEAQAMCDILEMDLEKLQEKKTRNLWEIVSFQTRLKHLQALKEGKYTVQCRTEQALQNELQRQENHMYSVASIIDRIQQEYPQYQGPLRKVSQALALRLRTTEEECA